MPKRTDISTILIIGAGPIIIGQACEFDYSGTQACKALRAEGYRIILVNSNPATIMTDPDLADRTYLEPITPEIVAKIIAKERSAVRGGFALLPTMGGQTALNCALSLRKMGVLEKFGVEMIGASAAAIDMAEDRELFREAMTRIGLATPRSHQIKTLAQALAVFDDIGLPAIIRPSFTLGGTGGGIAYNKKEYIDIVELGIDASPTNEVLVEESVLGWKEFEMEVVRDKADNCIIVCSIENVDPMGVHTGDSITVAPALTLTDKEYQIMRDAAIAVLREIGVETGGSNVQFAINPKDGRMVVIEMNPRVSRSSALASKATGFPIAKVAAKLAIGFTLDEIANEITGGVTPASFEPAIDYVVTKIPRFAFEKFPGAEHVLTTSMKSVGETMAIGRTFAESLQKGLRSLDTGLDGLDEIEIEGLGHGDDMNVLRAALGVPTPDRLLVVAQALRHGMSQDEIYEACGIDPWFIERIAEILDLEARVRANGLPADAANFRMLKAAGFSDARLAGLAGVPEAKVSALRRTLGVRPAFKRIDTCAAEFSSPTAYMYSTYAPPFGSVAACEARPSTRKKIVVLGGGPNRIGQGIEFDYCCCHASFALQEFGIESIMVNCNPETVSTDYDTSDRLYFEPLTLEEVLNICDTEKPDGVIVQFGGQTPLTLALPLKAAGVPIIGTDPENIDLAEDRKRFGKLLDELQIPAPSNGSATNVEEACAVANAIGFPVLVRPSYVLGGRAMVIAYDEEMVRRYMQEAVVFSQDRPVLIDRFLEDATEVDVDALADQHGEVLIAGIMEHIEEAGVHSGDSSCVLPATSLAPAVIETIRSYTERLARALNVIGLMNVQYAVKDGVVYVLEVNPRASRTAPYVSKATGVPLPKIAVGLMLGKKISEFTDAKGVLSVPQYFVKSPVFPFNKFPGVDPTLGPEMRSTGEVMGVGENFGEAFAKAQLSAGTPLPDKGRVFLSVNDRDKLIAVALAKRFTELGFEVTATRGTAAAIRASGVNVKTIFKVNEGRPNAVDLLKAGSLDLIIYTATSGAHAFSDEKAIRRNAVTYRVPCITTMSGARASVEAIASRRRDPIRVWSLQEIHGTISDKARESVKHA